SSSSYASSWCKMAYRWNLDYVVDPHGNSMVYYYSQSNNLQDIAGSSTTTTSYNRSSVLTRIDYGLRAGSESVSTAPARVLFTVSDRCWTASCGTHNATNWPDTPWDLDCSTAPCGAPTFWTTKRLTKIETQVWTGTGTTYRDVDSYALS